MMKPLRFSRNLVCRLFPALGSPDLGIYFSALCSRDNSPGQFSLLLNWIDNQRTTEVLPFHLQELLV